MALIDLFKFWVRFNDFIYRSHYIRPYLRVVVFVTIRDIENIYLKIRVIDIISDRCDTQVRNKIICISKSIHSKKIQRSTLVRKYYRRIIISTSSQLCHLTNPHLFLVFFPLRPFSVSIAYISLSLGKSIALFHKRLLFKFRISVCTFKIIFTFTMIKQGKIV